ncbi:MAG: universal stress protein [Phaeodactylibacter sp.]|nr:universal stress protein [Phaeodactylibacter sp.]MCB9264036.1 universal stress protein [Lewinellaceae bacterium]MCB9289888.1 universal stress protein [Lewinellaceae bacterium]
MKKILFPTDFSETASNAFRYAVRLAEALEARVDVMNVYHLPLNDASRVPADYIERMLSEKKQSVEAHLREFTSECSPRAIGELKAEYGIFVYQEVIDKAEDEGYNLIVMGTKGERNAIEKMMGSVTTHTMMHAPCPVLAIPEGADFQPISHIAYATDFEPSDEHAVEQLMEFAGKLGSAIHFVHIDTKAVAGSMEDYVMVENYPFPFTDFSVVGSRSVAEGLDEFVTENQIDILALFIPNRRLWERLFHTSFTKQMAFHAKVPLLVFRG